MKLVSILLLVAATAHGANDLHDLPFTANRFCEHENRLYPADLDLDGHDEIIMITRNHLGQQSLRVQSGVTTSAYYQSNFYNATIDMPPFAFHDENSEPVIVVPLKKGYRGYIRVIKPAARKEEKDYMIATGKDRNGTQIWDFDIHVIKDFDFNNDSHTDILVNARASYDHLPRALIAFDIHNGEEIWRYSLGTGLQDNNVVITSTETPRILLGSAAFNNGVCVNHLTDSLSYLLQFSVDGTLFGAKAMGGPQTDVSVQDLDYNGDGKKEIAVLLNSKNIKKQWPGQLSLWDGEMAFKTRQLTFSAPINYMCSGDIHGDGHDDILLTSSSESVLYVVTSRCDTVMRVDLPSAPNDITLANLKGDSRPEIVVRGMDRNMILDQNLNLLAQIPDRGRPVAVRRGFEHPAILALSSHRETNLYRLEKRKPKLILSKTAQFLLLLILVVAAASVYLLLRFYRHRQSIRQIEQVFDSLPVGVMLISRKNRVLAVSKSLQTWLQKPTSFFIGKNYTAVLPQELLYSVTLIVEKLQNRDKTDKVYCGLDQQKLSVQGAIWEPLAGGKIVFFHDISMQAQSQRTLEWAAMGQRLAHEIKNPLSILRLTLERLQLLFEEHNPKHGDLYREQVDSMYEEIDRLRKATDGFMKLVKVEQTSFSFYSVDTLLHEIEKKYINRLPRHVSLEINKAKHLPELKLDLEQMLVVFSNLIDNGVRAMQGKGKLHLEVNAIQKINAGKNGQSVDFVLLELSDTGCGIAEADLRRLFDPFYSKSSGGTGLGLAIAKRIVEEHGGEITVKSKLNAGTTVQITLPVHAGEPNHDPN